MSNVQSAHLPAAAPAHPLTLSLVGLLAAGAGLSVAALYYSQPMLGELQADLGAGARAVGLVPTLTQLGYAAGIFFLAPLGDRYDRRGIILAKAAALVMALLVAGAASAMQRHDQRGRLGQDDAAAVVAVAQRHHPGQGGRAGHGAAGGGRSFGDAAAAGREPGHRAVRDDGAGHRARRCRARARGAAR